jgi:hypothetical protein
MGTCSCAKAHVDMDTFFVAQTPSLPWPLGVVRSELYARRNPSPEGFATLRARCGLLPPRAGGFLLPVSQLVFCLEFGVPGRVPDTIATRKSHYSEYIYTARSDRA